MQGELCVHRRAARDENGQRRHLAPGVDAGARCCRQSRGEQAPHGEVAVRVDVRGPAPERRGSFPRGGSTRRARGARASRTSPRGAARSCRGDAACDAAASAAARAKPLSGREGAGSFASRKTSSISARSAPRASRPSAARAARDPPSGAVERGPTSPRGPTTTSPSASTRTTSSRTRRHASPRASSSGTAGAIAPRAAVTSSKARARRARPAHLSGCTARDRRACASLASAQPAPGSRSRTAGAPTGAPAALPHGTGGEDRLQFVGVSGRFGSGRFRRRGVGARRLWLAFRRLHRYRRGARGRGLGLTRVVAFLLLALPARARVLAHVTQRARRAVGRPLLAEHLPERDHVVVQLEERLQPEAVQALAQERVHRGLGRVLGQLLQRLLCLQGDPAQARHDAPDVHVHGEVRAVQRQQQDAGHRLHAVALHGQQVPPRDVRGAVAQKLQRELAVPLALDAPQDALDALREHVVHAAAPDALHHLLQRRAHHRAPVDQVVRLRRPRRRVGNQKRPRRQRQPLFPDDLILGLLPRSVRDPAASRRGRRLGRRDARRRARGRDVISPRSRRGRARRRRRRERPRDPPPAAINADAPLAAETSSGGMGDIDVGDRNAGRFSSFSSSAFRVGGARLRLRSASPPPETRPITAHIAAAASAVSAAPATSATIVSLTTDRVSADAGADANVAARVASSSSSSSPI